VSFIASHGVRCDPAVTIMNVPKEGIKDFLWAERIKIREKKEEKGY